MTDGPPTHALDLRQLLAILEHHAVDYTVIGGIAVQVHGHRRTTKDLDVIPSPETGNLQRLSAALHALAAVPRGMPGSRTPTVEQLETAAIVPPLTTRHGELHILRDVPGAPPYGDLRSRALVVELDGLAIAIAGLDDLIAMKRASARPSDLRDIAALVAAADHRREG
jgi:hypothetical protein